MIGSKVARRYAKALFEVARDRAILDQVQKELEDFNRLVDGNEELRSFLFDPSNPASSRKAVVKEISSRLSCLPVMTDFLCLLVDKGRIRLISTVTELFTGIIDSHLGRVRAEVTTAVPLDESSMMKLKEKVESLTGKRALLSKKVDPSILGGVVIGVDGLILDGSLDMRLKKLRATFNRRG